ncbi:hypothetical protein BST91_07970 [Nonlabens tegetincola]|uniref:glycosyltransferase n=1 Tax=Nonlabens tegetincola TaxID=323273 RepID=UPI000A2016C9|nr:glycosyltransferase [Nonlabens tegetincola]ARN71581.1 hypothetical protein BST91_07970 [Nonlabens tegetincola]
MNIPKVIHYCWFGDRPLSPLMKRCIDTWKNHCPDYEIKEWNLSNIELDIEFAQNAYNKKKWAFLADYIRFKVLYEQGGIYMDTDMYLISSFDKILKHKCILGFEAENLINCAFMASYPNHQLIKECLKYYQEPFEDYKFKLAIPRVTSRAVARLYGFDEFALGTYISNSEVTIYPPEVFYPYPYNKNRSLNPNFISFATAKTIGIHLWNNSWVEFDEFELLRRSSFVASFKRMIRNPKGSHYSIKYWSKYLKTFLKSIFNS